jgi:hypothetical protein
MSTQVQYRRGTATENNSFTGALAEITVDTTNKTIRVHDGATAGGSNIATVSYVTAAIGALSANSISSGTSNVRVVSSGGNVTTSVGGTADVLIITSTGANIAGYLTATGNITGGNLNLTGDIVDTGAFRLITSASGNITLAPNGSNVLIATTTGADITGTLGVTGNITFGGSLIDTAALEIITGSNGNITLSPNGTGVIVANKDIRNGQANGVGNIGTVGGFFNTIFAKATSAQYADLAEMYVADANYPAGTVVEFGGTHEITISSASHSTAVAGIISTNPSYLMNSTQQGEHVLPVALTGRVPCQVQGPVRKGDVLVASSTPGVAQRIGMNWQPGCVVGKAMEVIDSAEIKTIEVAVGRL